MLLLVHLSALLYRNGLVELTNLTGIIPCKVVKCPGAMTVIIRQGGLKFLVLTNNDVKSWDIWNRQSLAVTCKLNLQVETQEELSY